MRKRKRQVVKKLIQCAAIIAAGVLAIILFMLAIWYRGKNSEPVTDEQVAAQMQQGDTVELLGRYQSRQYEKVLDTATGEREQRTAYEVSVRLIRRKEEARNESKSRNE